MVDTEPLEGGLKSMGTVLTDLFLHAKTSQ